MISIVNTECHVPKTFSDLAKIAAWGRLGHVPVIFITAFPERLLTGERPEPTYLITKPFSPATVAATIDQSLLFHREAAGAGAILI